MRVSGKTFRAILSAAHDASNGQQVAFLCSRGCIDYVMDGIMGIVRGYIPEGCPYGDIEIDRLKDRKEYIIKFPRGYSGVGFIHVMQKEKFDSPEGRHMKKHYLKDMVVIEDY